jgi:NAD(P)-dependent dehydrogenase (short-subunit alcohol dehydrogenase family)
VPQPVIDLTDRVVLVTGAAAGLGRAIAAAAATAGADVAAVDRNGTGLEELGAGVLTAGRRVHTGTFDVRDGDAVGAFVTEAVDELGRLDVVVNNAGGTFRSPFLDVSPKGRDALIAENFTSVCHVITAAVPHLPRGGSIVNVTSIEAHRACPGFAIYAAMKAAVDNLTRSLALELGPQGIRVNAVAPDAIPTGGEAALAADIEATGYEHSTPLGRLGAAEEIVGPVLFLASDAAAFVTGTTLHVDGGNDAARGWRLGPDGAWRP